MLWTLFACNPASDAPTETAEDSQCSYPVPDEATCARTLELDAGSIWDDSDVEYYDDDGRLLQSVDDSGDVIIYTYDDQDRWTVRARYSAGECGTDGVQTREYPTEHSVVETTEGWAAQPSVERWDVDDAGEILNWEYDEEGDGVFEWYILRSFDEQGRKTSESVRLDNSSWLFFEVERYASTWTYEGEALVVSTHVAYRTWDELNYSRETIYEDGRETHIQSTYYSGEQPWYDLITDFEYDESGHLVYALKTEDSDFDGVSDWVWDELDQTWHGDRLVSTAYRTDFGYHAFTTYTYTDGLLSAARARWTDDVTGDSELFLTHYAYDALGQLVLQAEDDGGDGTIDHATQYDYDGDGHLILQEDGR